MVQTRGYLSLLSSASTSVLESNGPSSADTIGNRETAAAALLQCSHTRPFLSHANMDISHGSASQASTSHSRTTAPTTEAEGGVWCSMMGFGIDPMVARDRPHDATEAAVKAVLDASERGLLPSFMMMMTQRSQHHLRPGHASEERSFGLHIKLGVPRKSASMAMPSSELMDVDQERIVSMIHQQQPSIMRSLAILPMEVSVGGLWVETSPPSSQQPSWAGSCAVVACLSVRRILPSSSPENRSQPPPQVATLVLPTRQVEGRSSATNQFLVDASQLAWDRPASQAFYAVMSASAPAPSAWTVIEANSLQDVSSSRLQFPPGTQILMAATEPGNNQVYHRHEPEAAHQQQEQEEDQQPTQFHRSTSIDVLARVSAEIHDQQPHRSNYSETYEDDKVAARNAANAVNYNYKKLPPGVTPKNNKRLFVKHSYRDHSYEVPRQDETDLIAPDAPLRTPQAAFPLKLHEILSQIELDGYGDVAGWLPHGRSFKIHKQQEFVDTILPRYFVMTKKSSFLRQLNLYSFNRISGPGPDQGSYYHEKFLRGMKFLSRRMQRQKVNGNGIRAAGNPDDEPNLSLYPVCPHPNAATGSDSEEAVTQDGNLPLVVHLPPNAGDVGNNRSPNSQRPKQAPALNAARDRLPSISSLGNRQLTMPQSVSSSSTKELPDSALKVTAGLHASFPLKLQRILDKLEADGHTEVISWLSHGRAFLVKDVDRFVDELMPLHFNQTKYSSFQRQLHMYNFLRITAGRDKGAYHHPNFLRGRPELSMHMQRTRVNGKGTRRPGNPHEEPDLYKFLPLPPIPRGSKIEIPTNEEHSSSSSSSAVMGRACLPSSSSHDHEGDDDDEDTDDMEEDEEEEDGGNSYHRRNDAE